nr:putative reverse transcriptase domain-containing protein [Tanacetum cinerariifolium]
MAKHQNEVNEIRVKRLSRTANPLALVAQQQQIYHPQNHPTHYTQNSSTISQQAATRNRGKAIVNSPPPIYDQEPFMVAKNDEMINRGTGYENQRIGNVAGARETVEDQELEAHYMYMAQIQEVTPDVAYDFGPIFDIEPLQKVPNNDHYNVFTIECEHLEQYESVNDTYLIEQDKHNVIIDSLDMSYDREQIDQNDDDDDLAMNAQIKLYETREDKELDKVIALENKVKVLDNIVYSQSVQTINMLNRNCKTSFAKPDFLKKAQRANPHLYDIGCYNDNLNSIESFNKQTTLLEKRLDESISYDQKCKSSKELFKIKRSVATIFVGVERCKQTIAKRTYFGHIDPFIQNTFEANLCPEIRRINADIEKFHVCLKEEMVADLRYFNSLELEVYSLRSQLETQKTQFLNEIDRLSREYYYANHMNAIIGVYTELDEVINLQFGDVSYRLELPQQLSRVHNTFHVSNLKKCLSDESFMIMLNELRIDDRLHFVKEPMEIMDCEIKQLKRNRIPIIKIRWNSKRGPKFTWE